MVLIFLSKSPCPGRSCFCSGLPGTNFWVTRAPVILVSLGGLELDPNPANLTVLAESLLLALDLMGLDRVQLDLGPVELRDSTCPARTACLVLACSPVRLGGN